MDKKPFHFRLSRCRGFLIGFFVFVIVFSSLCVRSMYELNQLTKVGLNYSNLNMVSGQHIQLKPVKSLDFSSNILSSMKWECSNNSVVTIDNTGFASALTIGNATIRLVHFTGKIIGSCAIEVLTVGEYLIRTYAGRLTNQNTSDNISLYMKAAAMTDFVEDLFGKSDEIDKIYYNKLDRTDVTHLWGLGIQLMVLAQATKNNSSKYANLLTIFINSTLSQYWDGSRLGYQPSFKPNLANDDRYYDDNAWIGMGLITAYEATGSPDYLKKAVWIFRFLQEGQELSTNNSLNGGIYWHVSKKSLHTCSSAPTAFFCFQLSQYLNETDKIAVLQCGNLALEWCLRMMQDPSDNLFYDNFRVEDGHIDKAKYTYNTAMVIRSLILRYKIYNNSLDYERALAIANNSEVFFDLNTNTYKGAIFFSYLLIQADLELFSLNQTHTHFFQRAQSSYINYWENLNSSTHIITFQNNDIKTYAALASIFWMFA